MYRKVAYVTQPQCQHLIVICVIHRPTFEKEEIHDEDLKMSL